MGRDKLRLPVEGRPMLAAVVTAAAESHAGVVTVVTGADAYADVLADSEVDVVSNPAYADGLASSIRAGVGAFDADVYGILLGDMPFVRSSTIADIAREASPDGIVVPFQHALPGHPVFFGARFREALLDLRGDSGARSVIRRHADAALRVEVDDPGILRDIDTDEVYRAVRGGHS